MFPCLTIELETRNWLGCNLSDAIGVEEYKPLLFPTSSSNKNKDSTSPPTLSYNSAFRP